MFDWQAARGSPCIICRGIAVMIGLSVLSTFNDHGVAESDIFGLRHYTGIYIPPTADMFLTFVQVGTVWILCEWIIVDRLMRRKAAGGGGSR